MDSFGAHGTLQVGSTTYRIARLAALQQRGFELSRLPYALRILLENLLRRDDPQCVEAPGTGDRSATPLGDAEGVSHLTVLGRDVDLHDVHVEHRQGRRELEQETDRVRSFDAKLGSAGAGLARYLDQHR